MESPKVVNQLNDPANDVQYTILAYRRMTRTEILQAVGMYIRTKKGKQPKRGSRIQITSIIGFDNM